ncbi:MAG: hypothetical protein U0N62_04410 [Hydrogeniiclostridium sp.]
MYNKQREIIPTRQLEIKLSEEDVRKITSKAGEHGMTVAELIEHFIGDLVDGTYTSGSDERACADYWLERCGFGRFSDTFLQYLFENQILDDVLEEWDDIEDAQKEISYYAEHPEEAEPGELGEIQECLQESKEQLDEYWNSYTQQKTGYSAFNTFDEEMKKVLEWREERKRFLGD